jgi:hypothetical protein
VREGGRKSVGNRFLGALSCGIRLEEEHGGEGREGGREKGKGRGWERKKEGREEGREGGTKGAFTSRETYLYLPPSFSVPPFLVLLLL